MSFIGPVSRLGGGFIRPHDIELRIEPNGSTTEAMIERVVHLGFEVRVELELAGGERLWAQVTRDQAEQLELQPGDVVFVRPSRTPVFAP
jgi:sulfate transport system ATP-binding protein